MGRVESARGIGYDFFVNLPVSTSESSFGPAFRSWLIRSFGTGALLTFTGVAGLGALVGALLVPGILFMFFPRMSGALLALACILGPLVVFLPVLLGLIRLVDEVEQVLTAPNMVSSGMREVAVGQLSVAPESESAGQVSLADVDPTK